MLKWPVHYHVTALWFWRYRNAVLVGRGHRLSLWKSTRSHAQLPLTQAAPVIRRIVSGSRTAFTAYFAFLLLVLEDFKHVGL